MRKLTISQLAVVGVMTAVICIASPLSIPIGVVPISLANFVICIAAYALGARLAFCSCLIYLCIGLIGVPVFSGFGSGPGQLVGPTGGYLIGYLFLAAIAGIFIDRFEKSRILCFLGMVLGMAVCYLIGTAWLAYQMQMTAKAAFSTGVLLFLPGDFVKLALAAFIGPKLRAALRKAQLYHD